MWLGFFLALLWHVIVNVMNLSVNSPGGNYPASTVDAHLEKQIKELGVQVEKGFEVMKDNDRRIEADLRDLRNELRDNVSKEVFQSEVKRLDDNRLSDAALTAVKFSEFEKMLNITTSSIAGMKAFTWKAVTLATTLLGLVFTGVNVFIK